MVLPVKPVTILSQNLIGNRGTREPPFLKLFSKILILIDKTRQNLKSKSDWEPRNQGTAFSETFFKYSHFDRQNPRRHRGRGGRDRQKNKTKNPKLLTRGNLVPYVQGKRAVLFVGLFAGRFLAPSGQSLCFCPYLCLCAGKSTVSGALRRRLGGRIARASPSNKPARNAKPYRACPCGLDAF